MRESKQDESLESLVPGTDIADRSGRFGIVQCPSLTPDPPDPSLSGHHSHGAVCLWALVSKFAWDSNEKR